MATMIGFTTSRYNEHDILIAKLVKEFNRDKRTFISATAVQSGGIADLTEILVKSWIIQESGGSDKRSMAAWKVDPAQVNVPGDWSFYKLSTGLSMPKSRNEGTVEINLKAAIIWLARKGFGKSGQPPINRANAIFDGWKIAFERYNGRSVNTANNMAYSKNYAQRIIDRVENPQKHYPIELPKP